MNIKFNHDTGDATVDIETFRKLNQGTKFQQDINLLRIISNIIQELQTTELESLNLTPPEYERALKVCAMLRADYLRLNPPPGVDDDTVRIFCD